ncbi:MAG: DUF4147 domain-containing protein [Phycisphaerales bacterium]|nr:DUF4147 domain-containing protein [Phycisphaerales bacterium]
MIPIELSTKLDIAVQKFTREFVSHILTRCDPGMLVSESADFTQFTEQTHVLAFGKASAKMAQACERGLGQHFAGGVVLAPDSQIPHPLTDSRFQYHGVDHPSPTSRNVAATEALVRYARSIPVSHNCIVCISGGGSAHLCSPKPGITLEQITETASALNARGASIHELNELRRGLETLKAGGLAEVLGHVHYCHAIVLSDVLDDDLDTVASGPMMNPEYVVGHEIVGNHRTALDAAAEFVGRDEIGLSRSGISGESSDQGRTLAGAYRKFGPVACLIAGETTVDASSTSGVGGPCLELVLACALQLAELGCADWVALGLATDGIDGPTDAAGAVITAKMLACPERQLAARKALLGHNTLPFLDSIHATIGTGPTGTNLNDLCCVCPSDAL